MPKKNPVLVARSHLANASRVREQDPERYARALEAFHEAKMNEAIGLAITYAGGDREKVAAAALQSGGSE